MSGIFSKAVSTAGTARRRFSQWSLAARAATFVALALCLLVLVTWTVFLLDPRTVPWRHSLSLERVLTVCILLIVIPPVIYRALRLWLEGDAPPFPEINYAWRAGIDSLESHGLDLRTLPVFLVIGSTDERQERDLMTASGLEFRCQGVPEGPAAMHWYASPKGVFIHCQQSSCTSALAALHDKKSTDAVAARLTNLEAPTMIPSPEPAIVTAPAAGPVAAKPASPQPAPAAASAPSPAASKAVKGTITLDQFLSQQPAATSAAGQPASAPAAAPGSRPKGADRGTLMLEPIRAGAAAAAAPATAPAVEAAVMPPEHPLPTMYADPEYSLRPQIEQEHSRRLQYVCQLLRRVRQPLCGINGVLVLVSFKALQESERATEALGRAIKNDLRTIQTSLQLRAPVTALVAGLEQEAGFRELVRRVGRERAAVQRFGRGFDVRSPAGVQELRALCEHVTGAFEDWIYALFREQGSLERPGNAHLYSLLGKVRSQIKSRLAHLLVRGFAHDERLDERQQPQLFNGCYLAACGPSEDRQAFAHAVFEKLMDEQEHVEWTGHALKGERFYTLAAIAGIGVDVLLAAALAASIAYRVAWR